MRQKSNVSEGCKSAMKREKVMSKVFGLKKKGQEAQKRLKAQRQRDASRRQCQTAEQRARRLLDQCQGNVRRYENETTIATKRNQRQEYLHNQQLRLQRDDVSKDEQGLSVGPLFRNS